MISTERDSQAAMTIHARVTDAGTGCRDEVIVCAPTREQAIEMINTSDLLVEIIFESVGERSSDGNFTAALPFGGRYSIADVKTRGHVRDWAVADYYSLPY